MRIKNQDKRLNLPDAFDLRGKTALITGAAGLLGPEHAFALLELGAGIILTDVSEKRLCEIQSILNKKTSSGKISILPMDVTVPEQIEGVALKIQGMSQRVDILINNAAIDPKFDGKKKRLEKSRLENISMEAWNQEIGVGLTGAFLCSRIFGVRMAKDGKGGVILNIASDLSVISPDQRIYRKSGLPEDQQPVKPITYSVIKSGLVGLTRYLATYWANRGVRVNALSPGGVHTNQSEDFVKRLTNLIPLGRMAKKDEYRSAVQFLCSNASAYLNGQNIVIDGGRSVW